MNAWVFFRLKVIFLFFLLLLLKTRKSYVTSHCSGFFLLKIFALKVQFSLIVMETYTAISPTTLNCLSLDLKRNHNWLQKPLLNMNLPM